MRFAKSYPPHSDDLEVKLFDHCEDIGVVLWGDVALDLEEDRIGRWGGRSSLVCRVTSCRGSDSRVC